jgi:3-oxoacyl-[acyl-carrier protein] reductase
MKLNKKIVLVTGASKGIGRATAVALAKEGCSVIINYKSDSKAAAAVLKKCNSYSKGNIIIKSDVSKEDEVQKMFGEIKKRFSHIDIVINNAGIYNERDNITNVDAFENTYRTNFLSCVLVNKYSLPLMNEGSIVNVSSVHGGLGQGKPNLIAYSSFKAALDSYTKNLAKSLSPKILVNAVAPGRVATPMWGSPNKKEQMRLGRVHLIKRMIQPEEIADSIIFIVKNDAICGSVLTIDGGMSLVTRP